jgi:hypothetical protein
MKECIACGQDDSQYPINGGMHENCAATCRNLRMSPPQMRQKLLEDSISRHPAGGSSEVEHA